MYQTELENDKMVNPISHGVGHDHFMGGYFRPKALNRTLPCLIIMQIICILRLLTIHSKFDESSFKHGEK